MIKRLLPIAFVLQVYGSPVPIDIDLYSSDSFTGTSSAHDTVITVTNGSSLSFEDQSDPSDANISLSNDSSLQFNQTSINLYSGQLSGSGSVSKTGSGALTMSANNSGFTGPLSVANGTLFLAGSYGGAVSITSTGKVIYLGPISGNLDVPSGIITTNGTSPLTVGGNYTQSGTGTYIANTSSFGQSSLISIAGTAAIGGFVEVNASEGFLSNHQYTILHANGGVSGSYTLINPYPLLTIFVTYDANNVYLNSSGASFSSIAKTPNEKKVAEQLDALVPTNAAEANLLSSLAILSANEAENALNQMSGEQYSNLILSAFYEDNRFSKRIYNGYRKQIGPCQSFCGSIDQWVSGGYGRGFQQKNAATPGFHLSNYDIAAGLHGCVQEDWLLGGALGFETDFVHSDLKSRGTLRTGQMALYSAYQSGAVYLLANLIGANTWIDYRRNIQMGSTSLTAKSHPQMSHGRLDLQIGGNLGSCDFSFQPYGAGTVEFYHQKSISEQGTEAANLKMQAISKWLASNQLGLHFSINTAGGFSMMFDAAWQHYYGNLQVDEKTRFQDFGTPFLIEGPERGHDGALGAVYITQKIGKAWDIYLESEGELWQRWYSFAFNAGVNYKW